MPMCYRSNPSPQSQAENNCDTCPASSGCVDDRFVTRLTPEEYDKLMDALDNPPPPTEALVRLMRDHRDMMGRQSRSTSLLETVASTAIGFAVSLVLTAAVLPAFGYQTTWAHDFWITCIFTVASVFRGYAVRRSFEGLR